MISGFNNESEKPLFIHKPDPSVDRAYQIYAYFRDIKDYQPVGEYVLVDQEENPDLTEKTVMNLVANLNGRSDRMLDLKNMSDTRLLFNVVENDMQESNYITIMLRTHDGMGVSEENAVFKMMKGVFYGRFLKQ